MSSKHWRAQLSNVKEELQTTAGWFAELFEELLDSDKKVPDVLFEQIQGFAGYARVEAEHKNDLLEEEEALVAAREELLAERAKLL